MLIVTWALLLGCFGLVLSLSFRVRETSLVGCWFWTLVAFASLAIGSVNPGWLGLAPAIGSSLRFATDTAIFCPTISLFGARRPQHRGWNFIVLTLWLVLALPAAEALFVLRSEQVQLHAARIGFMWMVIGAGWFNHLFTRFAVPSCWFAVGQVALLSEFLVGAGAGGRGRSVGIVCLAVAVGCVWMIRKRQRPTHGWDRVWLDFRDLFGAIWALRLKERLNAAAKTSGWKTRIEWQGMTGIGERPAGNETAGVDTCLRAFLRRFVSPDWIDRRLIEARRPPSPQTEIRIS